MQPDVVFTQAFRHSVKHVRVSGYSATKRQGKEQAGLIRR